MEEAFVTEVQVSSVVGSRILRGVLAGMILTAVGNGFLFIGQLIIVRVLTRGEYAQFTLTVSFVSLLALLADLGLNALFTQQFAEAEEAVLVGQRDHRGQIIGTALGIRLVMSVVVASLVLIIGRLLFPAEVVEGMLIVAGALLVSSRIFAVRSVGECVLRSRADYRIVFIASLVDAVVFASALAFGFSTGLQLRGVLWVYVLANVPGGLILAVALKRQLDAEQIRLRFDFEIVKRFLRLGLPLILTTTFLTIHSQIDVLLLDRLGTPIDVSSYGAVIRVISAIAPGAVVVSGVVAPELTRLLRRADIGRSRRLASLGLRILLVLAFSVALILSLNASWLVTILLGPKYSSDSGLLILLAWNLVPMFVATLTMEMGNAAGRFWHPTIYTGFIMVAVVIGDLILIPNYGAMGALISKLAAIILGCLVLLTASRSFPFLDIGDIAKSTGFCILAAVIAVLESTMIFSHAPLLGSIFGILSFFGLIALLKVLSVKEIAYLFRKLQRRTV